MTTMEAIKHVHDKTGGKCGVSIVVLMKYTKKDLKALKSDLNALFMYKKIIIREGINHKLIFAKK